MESQKFHAQEIVTRGHAGGKLEVVPSVAGDHAIDSPLSIPQAVFSYLEPAEARGTGGSGIADLGQPVRDGTCVHAVRSDHAPSIRCYFCHSLTFVTGSNGVVGVVGPLRSADDMPPPCADARTWSDSVHIVVLVLEVLVAGELSIVDVLERVVAVGSADTPELALVCAVDGYLLEDRVPGGRGDKSQDDCGYGFHLDNSTRGCLREGMACTRSRSVFRREASVFSRHLYIGWIPRHADLLYAKQSNCRGGPILWH